MSSPANRTAWREEENRPAPASQQVIASAVTGPAPYSRAARTFAPARCRAASVSWCRTTCRRSSSAPVTSSAVATCSCPAGDRCAAAAARSSATPFSVRSAPWSRTGAPWWNKTAQLRLGGALAAQVGCWPGRRRGRSGPGRWKAPAGTGHLLAQQLLSAGERMLDVQPKLAARVRLLATGNINKNDPDDARSVAVAALRSAQVQEVRRDDHAAVLKVWSKRYRDLGRARTQVAFRLHQVLCELVPGGVPGEITAGRAGQILAFISPAGAVETG